MQNINITDDVIEKPENHKHCCRIGNVFQAWCTNIRMCFTKLVVRYSRENGNHINTTAKFLSMLFVSRSFHISIQTVVVHAWISEFVFCLLSVFVFVTSLHSSQANVLECVRYRQQKSGNFFCVSFYLWPSFWANSCWNPPSESQFYAKHEKPWFLGHFGPKMSKMRFYQKSESNTY